MFRKIGLHWIKVVALAAILGCLTGCAPRVKRPNIVLIVMDTVAAKHMSLYGAERNTTPELEQWAQRGRVYDQFYSTSCWTIPSHASLFTGFYPIRHRAMQEHLKLEEDFVTLAERLQDAGYQTEGISANAAVSRDLGFAQGFEEFVEMWRPEQKQQYSNSPIHSNNSAAENFLNRRDREKPFFLFLNYIDAHTPYEPLPERLQPFLSPGQDAAKVLEKPFERPAYHYLKRRIYTAEDFEQLRRLYDAELAHVSFAVGNLCESLEAKGLLENTVVVITSDHGENLGEKGHYTHVFALYRPTQWVPLIILQPGETQPGMRDGKIWQIHDLFPTLLEMAGINAEKIPHQALDMYDPDNANGRDAAFGEYYFPLQALEVVTRHGKPEESVYLEPYMRRIRCVQTTDWKLIWGSDGKNELYNIARDQDELMNLFDFPKYKTLQLDLEKRLSDYVARFEGDFPLPEEPTRKTVLQGFQGIVDEDTAKQLRTLGYLK